MFKNSFVSDIVEGMAYLHHSPLKSHGNLKSSNCLVDSRWMIKITGHGMKSFQSDPQKDTSEYEIYRDMLWTAPELLRLGRRVQLWHHSTRDHSSFFTFLHRIIANEKLNEEVHRLASNCWAEQPGDRRNFEDIKRQRRKLNRGRQRNIVDTMISKLEKTSELIEEKKKTDTLLYRMLPRTVAENLKTGKSLEAELYDSATIYFSDIVGFTALSSESSPMEVVQLLNDLYTMFDSIIAKYDVYKVETIGDAYMVASGLPVRNGERHAREVACMALDLLHAISEFKVHNKPEYRMKLRIGLHTGPCAAGVVGQTMPRYCLFGDTVNTASRMESTGEALKIHISHQTKDALAIFPGFLMKCRGEISVKGKGNITTY
ncbi:hypothetical protein CAPTEDRAFT_201779 [Capitella teleta]|uniref:Guanylate cyclase n=1 Tax=Capitella teleta TaxID=283909 RepID=R7U3Z9_CAPTE|nr:hypothetical protein CAPTEDRAFT_201779 [Capitella teleta]|eukprot:ELU01070.1 hypothetical protein CAPTEDRAFT_201779 [Capitella teleta]